MDNKLSKNQAFKAAIWYVLSNIIVKSIGILTTPIVARMMSKSEYGEVATFTSWHAILAVFFSLNLTYSVGRAKLDYSEQLDCYIGSCQVLSALTSFFFICIILFFQNYSCEILGLNKYVMYLLVLYLFCEPAVLFFANGCRYRYYYKQNIAIAIFTAITSPIVSIFLMRINPDKMVFYRVVGIITPTVLISVFLWLKSVIKKSLCVNLEYWKYGLSLSLPLIFHTISLHLLSQSDRIFILKICGDEYVGLYSLVYSYGILLSTVSSTINQGWLPWFHDTYFEKNFNAIRANVKPFVLLACYIALASIAFAPEAVIFLGGAKYSEGVSCVLPVVLGVLCQFVYGHYVNIELHLKKTKYVAYGTAIAALVNLFLNAIFIGLYGYVAAAYTTLASYLVLMLAHVIFTKKIMKVNLYNDRFMFLSIVVTSAIGILVQNTYCNNILRLFVILIGFIAFTLTFKKYFGIIGLLIKNKLKIKD